jgi:hypothetical protein
MNLPRASLLLACAACAALSAGCKGSTTSDLVPTNNIAADITASDDGNGSVLLSVHTHAISPGGDDQTLLLVGDDHFQATFGKQASALSDEGGGVYETAFNANATATSDIVLSLARTKFDAAPESVGTMPESVALDGFEGATISRGVDSIDVQLPQTVGAKSVDIEGPCISSLHYDLGTSAGDLYIGPGDVYSSNAYAECYVNMTVTTALSGSPDPKLHPRSTFLLTRSRTTSFYSVP